jgi:hypothetical protein
VSANEPNEPGELRTPGEPRKPEPRRAVTGADAAGAGALMLATNAVCAGIGAAIGALVGAFVPLLLVGFAVGFGLGIRVVIRRFSDP